MNVPDTSVVVPALARWHPQHDIARRPLRPGMSIVGHCVAESYSVLTRLPDPHGMQPAIVCAALEKLFASALVLDAEPLFRLPNRLAESGVRGGATYDGLIAFTASHHGARLLTLDRRAAKTYHACGVEFELLAN